MDIGSGRGAFLSRLKKEKSCAVFGLEFNQSACEYMQANEIASAMQSIEEHSKENAERYDVPMSADL